MQEEYSIKSIIWESTYSKLNINLNNGKKGLFYGKLNCYKLKNEVSFIIYKVKFEKEKGDIYSTLEKNRKICRQKGFFDKIPKNITNFNNIGLITRYNSAAYNDLVNSINNCYGINVFVYD